MRRVIIPTPDTPAVFTFRELETRGIRRGAGRREFRACYTRVTFLAEFPLQAAPVMDSSV